MPKCLCYKRILAILEKFLKSSEYLGKGYLCLCVFIQNTDEIEVGPQIIDVRKFGF